MKISQFYRELMAAGLPLMKNVLTPLSKMDFIPLGLSAEMSATDPLAASTLGNALAGKGVIRAGQNF